MSTTCNYVRLPIILSSYLVLILVLVACGGGTVEDVTQTAEAPAQLPQPTETAVEATAGSTAEALASASAGEPTEAAPSLTPSVTVGPTATAQTPLLQETLPPPATATAETSQVTEVSLALVVGGFTSPVYLTHAFDDRLFVVEQAGRVKIIEGGQVQPEPFLDISGRVGSTALEQGLLSVAFHPQYQENGRFFVDYTDTLGDTVIAEYQVDADDPSQADAGTEHILLTVDQPYSNHNGGQLQFGPDGYLYVGLGDGGSAGDPLNNGQNPGTLLGTVLRLDVDNVDPGGELAYGIPADNPFVGVDGARDEVWAYGLRNPWRFSFDRSLGDLYLSDVGQNLWEEVNFQAADSAGGNNYGWNVMEASTCFGAQSCDSNGFVMPVAEYPHQEGSCSISGGYVYRGSMFPDLTGNYFFADYCSGTFWSLFGDQEAGWQQLQLQRTGMFIPSFGEDWRGELYIIDRINGDVYQLQS